MNQGDHPPLDHRLPGVPGWTIADRGNANPWRHRRLTTSQSSRALRHRRSCGSPASPVRA